MLGGIRDRFRHNVIRAHFDRFGKAPFGAHIKHNRYSGATGKSFQRGTEPPFDRIAG